MKYKVGESEKITKDDKDYQVWKISEQAGFFLADGMEGEDAVELIDRIIASCSALAVKMESDTVIANKTGNTAQKSENDKTEKTSTEKAAKESIAANSSEKPQKQGNIGKTRSVYLLRKRTGEKIVIDKEVFKLGKDAACVDYVVDDNPTISRNHADIIHKKDGYYVKDKSSLNHTFVDGKKLEAEKPVKLESGSLLQLADEVFEWKQE